MEKQFSLGLYLQGLSWSKPIRLTKIHRCLRKVRFTYQSRELEKFWEIWKHYKTAFEFHDIAVWKDFSNRADWYLLEWTNLE